MILDKLIEKKDVFAYIKFRTEQLQQYDIKIYPKKERELQRQRLMGRLRELKHLKDSMNSGIKKESIAISESLYKEQNDELRRLNNELRQLNNKYKRK